MRPLPIGSPEWKQNFEQQHNQKEFFRRPRYGFPPNRSYPGDEKQISFEKMMESQRLAQLALQDFEQRREKTLSQIRAGK
jgi:hypothetical protein